MDAIRLEMDAIRLEKETVSNDGRSYSVAITSEPSDIDIEVGRGPFQASADRPLRGTCRPPTAPAREGW